MRFYGETETTNPPTQVPSNRKRGKKRKYGDVEDITNTFPVTLRCPKYGSWNFACSCLEIPETGYWDAQNGLSYIEV